MGVMSELELQDNFPEWTRDDWRLLAEKGLRGAEFQTLISQTEDGLTRGPLFDVMDRPDQHAPLPRTSPPLLEGRPWHICANISDSNLDFANEQLLADLKGGASAVRIDTLAIGRRADLKRLLEGVFLDLVPIIFAPGCAAASYAPSLDELTNANVTLGLDPLGDRPDAPDHWRVFTANAATIHEAGGSDVIELAGFAAMIAESFRRHGPEIHTQISALLAAGTDAHLNIIKFRAARRLYGTIADAFGIDTHSLPVHAISSLRMMQSQDAWTNMLRTMSAGFGAVTGGADYITLRPFTDVAGPNQLGGATPFGHRVARNQQLLMMEESHLGQVKDVAYGSYFHEKLTDDLAREAWAKFQAIEKNGGIVRYIDSGELKADCDAATQVRQDRGDPILGVTLHPSDHVPTPETRS